jgi:hypothetical protein
MAKIEVINGNATIDPATGEINVTAEKGVTTKVDTTAAPAPTPGASFTPAPQKGTGAVAPQSSFVPPTCPSCGAPLSSGAHYCSKCGIDISKALPVVFCAKCGKPLPYSEAAYCPSCGAHLLPEHKDQPRPAAAQPGVINVGEPTTKKPDKFKHHAGHILGEGISMLIFLGIAVAILILGGVLDTYPYAVYGLGAAAVLALVAGILAMVQVHAKGKVLGILCFVFMAIALGGVSFGLVYAKSGLIAESFYYYEYGFVSIIVNDISHIMDYLGSAQFWLNLGVLVCVITGAVLALCAFFWSLSFMIKSIHRKPEAETK